MIKLNNFVEMLCSVEVFYKESLLGCSVSLCQDQPEKETDTIDDYAKDGGPEVV